MGEWSFANTVKKIWLPRFYGHVWHFPFLPSWYKDTAYSSYTYKTITLNSFNFKALIESEREMQE